MASHVCALQAARTTLTAPPWPPPHPKPLLPFFAPGRQAMLVGNSIGALACLMVWWGRARWGREGWDGVGGW